MEQWTKSIVSRYDVACKSCPTSPCQFPSADSRQVGRHSGYDTLTPDWGRQRILELLNFEIDTFRKFPLGQPSTSGFLQREA